MDAVSMGLDFGLPVSDIQKVVKSNQEAPVMKAIIIGLRKGLGKSTFYVKEIITSSRYGKS